jgi:hypothetical protein
MQEYTNYLLKGTEFKWSTGHEVPIKFESHTYYAATLKPEINLANKFVWIKEIESGRIFQEKVESIPDAFFVFQMVPDKPGISQIILYYQMK